MSVMFEDDPYLIPAEESLAVQSVSKMGEALTRIFQEVIDYRDSLPQKERREKTFRYCKETMKVKLVKAVKDILNLQVENIIFYSKVPVGVFAIELGMGRTEIFNPDSGYGLGRDRGSTPSKELQEILDLYDALDPKTGKIKVTTYGVDNHQVFIVLHMDLTLAFFMNDYVDPQYVQDFTAQELAAIYLHEFGHFYTMIERLQTTFYITMRCSDHLKNMVKHSADEIVQAISQKQKELEKMGGDRKDTQLLFKTVDTVKYLNEVQQEEPGTISALYLTARLLTKCVIFLLENIVAKALLFPVITRSAFYYENINDIIKQGKTADFFWSKSALLQKCEQDADDYVSRSGYTEYLVSSLHKLTSFHQYHSVGLVGMKPLKAVGIAATLSELLINFYSDYEQGSRLYPSDLDRYKYALRNLIPAMKDLPEEVRLTYMVRYERTLKQIEEIEKLQNKNMVIKLRKFIDYVVYAPHKLIKNLVGGTIEEEYDKLVHQVEDIIDNKLYYYSTKLQSFANR